jgi:formyl-CoA transferase
VRHIDAFTQAVSAETRKRTRAELVSLFNAAGVACGPINSIDQVFADPQVASSDLVRSVMHPRLGSLDLLGSPIEMSGTRSLMESAAPDKGQHTDEVLREFGFSPAEIAGLRADGIVS